MLGNKTIISLLGYDDFISFNRKKLSLPLSNALEEHIDNYISEYKDYLSKEIEKGDDSKFLQGKNVYMRLRDIIEERGLVGKLKENQYSIFISLIDEFEKENENK